MPVLLRASIGYLSRHRWQSALSILGIALGVAVVIAVEIANTSALRAFDLSLETVVGRTTHQIESASGQIADARYVELRRHPDHTVAAALRTGSPVIEASVRIAGGTFQLLGVDLLSLPRFAGPSVEVTGGDLTRLLHESRTLLLNAQDLERLGIALDTPLSLQHGDQTQEVRVIGAISANQPGGLAGFAIADIATVQEITARPAVIDRIDLTLTPTAAATLAERLPQDLRLVAAAQRSESLRQMTRAFQTNLTAMSLLAVLVGGFIIYNTMTFAVVQRRQLFGSLRTLGATRAQLFRLIMSEAMLFACIGSALGLAMGILTGWGLVQLVTRTINDLYFALTVRELIIAPLSIVKAVGVGLLVTILAALGPALEAAGAQPRDLLREHSLERRGQQWVRWLGVLGILLAASGWGLAQIPSRSLGLGFVAILTLILGVSLCVPILLRLFAGLLARAAAVHGPLAAVLAARGVASSITRTGIAAAALTVAISSTIGVGVMIDSFRNSLIVWLDGTLQSDLYVAATSETGNRADGELPAALAERLRALDGIAELSLARTTRVETRAGDVWLIGVSPSSVTARGFALRHGTATDLWSRFEAGELILASEPYAYHQRVNVGDHIEFFTARGWQQLEIGGIFRDYGSDAGLLAMARTRYIELWDDLAISSLGIRVQEDADQNRVFAEVRSITEQFDVPIQTSFNEQIRVESLAVFDRTFAITQVLRLLAVAVAFIGVLSALMALELERRREHAVLRATGMTPGELASLILTQTSIVGLVAGLIAIPLGIVMAQLLIEVVNLRSFGWTMEMSIPAWPLISGLLLAWGAALLAGIAPAKRAAREDLAPALRSE
ncbi:hypothetical protein CKO25_13790 [Thiocapsa imhoffii]|uniref:ABC transporter permease n=1 Tax=Thiocapsa imhoffii TaxID=382777 RepID=A0A9X0WJI3_9GAMM|nr:ABC transporter permease [Thiocapsa imhoffii]MBK1645701.1 hypothetical protein [Thiocapsa imhoffii]